MLLLCVWVLWGRSLRIGISLALLLVSCMVGAAAIKNYHPVGLFWFRFHPIVLNYGSHFSISLNPVGFPYVNSARSLTTPSTAPASLFPCGYQPPHPSVPFWLYIFGALVQVRLDATSSNYANALVVRWCLLRCFWFVRGDPLRQGCPLRLSPPC